MLKLDQKNHPPRKSIARSLGVGQLSIVEHSLCPLESRFSLTPNLVHSAHYFYTDQLRRRRRANVRVFAPLGLSSSDEFYLWGLLALTLAQPDSDGCLFATPDWCLKQLGLIDNQTRRGGRQYQQFSAAIERLSVVSYLNDACYDPVKAEHRRVSFGFFSYSLPVDLQSSRAWRISWDRVFFDLVKTTGGSMRFDLQLYRALDPASRRMFLLLTKISYRKGHMPVFDLRHLAVDVLGLSPSLALRDMKVKVARVLRRLQDVNVLSNWVISRIAQGQFSVSIERGQLLNSPPAHEPFQPNAEQSPLIDGLLKLGFDSHSAIRIIRRYPVRLIAEWTDITQAALERFGPSFFHKSPMAYLVDSLTSAAQGTRTPPDWWHAIRKAEQRNQQPSTESRQLFARLIREVFGPEHATQEIRTAPSNNKHQPERASELLKKSF